MHAPGRLLALALLVALARPNLAAPGGEERTNVLVLLADDLGTGDLGCTGGWTRTPRIDALAKEGALFTQAYAAAPVCTPSRVGLLTGLSPARLGVQANTGANKVARKRSRGLPTEVVTVPERLHELGVLSGLVGKWHLGLKDGMTPVGQGFDEFFGFLGATHLYLPSEADVKMMRGEELEAEHEKEYLTDALAREAVAFLERHRDTPFALTVAFNAPHLPLEAPEEILARFPDLEGERKTYAAVVSALDDAVGRILDALEAHGLAERTLVVFASDNGADTQQGPGSNGRLALGKALLFEGGVRVPLLVRWPGHATPGARIDAPVSLLDVAATTLAVAGAPAETLAKLDGIPLTGLLAGEEAPARSFFWKLGPSAAVRTGDWKLVVSKSSRWLFDLAGDPRERSDLSAENPSELERLSAQLEAWIRTLPEPLWDNQAAETPIPIQGKSYWVEY